MLITINWQEAALLLAAWYALRYLYQIYLKWVTGHPTLFDPTDVVGHGIRYEDWQSAYLQGRASIVEEYGLEDEVRIRKYWNT